MTSSHKNPGVAFWATVVVVVALVAYPLSFGPACWLYNWKGVGESTIPIGYFPVIWLLERSGQRTFTRQFATCGVLPGEFPIIGDGGEVQWAVNLPRADE